VFAVTSDVAITGGLVYAGLRFGGTRARLAATVGFLAAPIVIDLLRKEFSS